MPIPAVKRTRDELIQQRLLDLRRSQIGVIPSGAAVSYPEPTATAKATATATAIEPDTREALGKSYPIPKTQQAAFKVLKLDRHATPSDIRHSYISNSRLVHPDKGSSNDERTRLECTAKQQQLQAAYELLIKPKGGKKRRTMQKSKSKRLNKHFKKSMRHTQT
jgi:hypothetical protein